MQKMEIFEAFICKSVKKETKWSGKSGDLPGSSGKNFIQQAECGVIFTH